MGGDGWGSSGSRRIISPNSVLTYKIANDIPRFRGSVSYSENALFEVLADSGPYVLKWTVLDCVVRVMSCIYYGD